MNKKTKPASSAKKDLKTKLSGQLHTALAEFKELIHEKKLQKLVKKAAKLLADGLHHNKPATKSVNKKASEKKTTPAKSIKISTVKKAEPKKAAKKATPKKAAKKK